MKMTIITTVIPILIVCLFAGHTRISIGKGAPFIRLDRPLMAIGLFLFIVGIACMFYSQYEQGRKAGQKDVLDLIKNESK